MQLRCRPSLSLPVLMLALFGAACDSPETVREIVDRLGRGGAGGGVDGGGGNRTCGGPTDIKCGPNEFCDFAAGSCGGGALGVCTARPQACTLEYSPVCGCDGKTYGNDCARLTAGVSKLRQGECSMVVEVGEGESCGGFRASPQRACKAGLACVDQPGRCGSMAADAPGVCQAVPAVCTKELRPVCGCDGQTYGNDCMRKAAKTGLAHEGECAPKPGGGEGARCGGIAGVPCARGFVCQPPPNSCKVADWQGTCTSAAPRPCPAIYKPVCGCDGKTYGNECALGGTGVGKDHDGECAKGMVVEVGEGESCGGFRAAPQRVCKAGLACVDQPGRCGSMAADAPGVCQAVTTACTREFRPVCGCDGQTYGNDCMRKAAKTGLNHEGECATKPGGGEGARCGGIAGFPCARGFVCQPPPNSCKVADWLGTCTSAAQRPCPDIYKPVCGCDGKTYGNECSLNGTGVGKDHDGECATTMSGLLGAGVWGGEHVVLTASEPRRGATIELDCASGTIQGPLSLGPGGEFKWPGKYTREGGPVPSTGRPSVDATYFGRVSGDTMELSIIVGGAQQRPLKLTRGLMGRLIKCL